MIGIDAQGPLGPQHPDIFFGPCWPSFSWDTKFPGRVFFREILVKQQLFAANTFAPQSHIDTDNLWTCNHDWQRGFDGCTQMDYMLAFIQLAPRIAAQALTLETVRDPTDHRPILLDLLTHSRRRVNKRQRVPPSKPKFLGWRLDAEISAKNNHTTAGYSDHILEQLELGEISGKFKDDWRRKLSDFDENST
jgi:hypothetical protein